MTPAVAKPIKATPTPIGTKMFVSMLVSELGLSELSGFMLPMLAAAAIYSVQLDVAQVVREMLKSKAVPAILIKERSGV